MSNLRLNSNLTQKQAFTHILHQLLDVHDNNQHAIRGWGQKLLGYGLKQTEFDLFKNSTYFVTTRIFRYNVDELLEKQLIRVFDKSTKTKKGPFYSITPLGLFYLLQHVEKFPKNITTKIFKHLEFYAEGNSNIVNELLKYFTDAQILKAMKNLFYYSQIDFSNNSVIFAVDVPLNSASAIRFLQVHINSQEIILHIAKMVHYSVNVPGIIDKNELNFVVSTTLCDILYYYLYDQTKNKKKIIESSKHFKFIVGGVIESLHMTLEDDLEDITKAKIRDFDSTNI